MVYDLPDRRLLAGTPGEAAISLSPTCEAICIVETYAYLPRRRLPNRKVRSELKTFDLTHPLRLASRISVVDVATNSISCASCLGASILCNLSWSPSGRSVVALVFTDLYELVLVDTESYGCQVRFSLPGDFKVHSVTPHLDKFTFLLLGCYRNHKRHARATKRHAARRLLSPTSNKANISRNHLFYFDARQNNLVRLSESLYYSIALSDTGQFALAWKVNKDKTAHCELWKCRANELPMKVCDVDPLQDSADLYAKFIPGRDEFVVLECGMSLPDNRLVTTVYVRSGRSYEPPEMLCTLNGRRQLVFASHRREFVIRSPLSNDVSSDVLVYRELDRWVCRGIGETSRDPANILGVNQLPGLHSAPRRAVLYHTEKSGHEGFEQMVISRGEDSSSFEDVWRPTHRGEEIINFLDPSKQILTRNRTSRREELMLCSLNTGAVNSIWSGELATIERPHRSCLLRYSRDDGLDLNGRLFTPVVAGSDLSEWLLVWIYPEHFRERRSAGKVLSRADSYTSPAEADYLWLLEAGVSVLQPQIPILTDRAADRSFTAELLSAIEPAVEAARRSIGHPIRKVAIGGHSYGACASAIAIANCEAFDAAILCSGAYNRFAMPFGFQGELRPAWAAVKDYVELSPILSVERIRTPTLLMHGLSDENRATSPKQSIDMYSALKMVGCKAKLLMIEEEGHVFVGAGTAERIIRETATWLRECDKSRNE